MKMQIKQPIQNNPPPELTGKNIWTFGVKIGFLKKKKKKLNSNVNHVRMWIFDL